MIRDGLAGADTESAPAFALGGLEPFEKVEEGNRGCGRGRRWRGQSRENLGCVSLKQSGGFRAYPRTGIGAGVKVASVTYQILRTMVPLTVPCSKPWA